MLIPTHLLKAALTCAATHKNSGSRPVLTHVLVEPVPRGAWIVSTDGSALFACKHEGDAGLLGDASVLIPRDTLEALFKIHKGSDVLLTPASVGPLTFTPYNGTFPDWRRVVPGETCSGIWPEQIDPWLLVQASKAVNIANLVTKLDAAAMLVQTPDSDKIVIRGAREDCIAVMMGRRVSIYDDNKQRVAYRRLSC